VRVALALGPVARLLIAREWRHHPWRHALALFAVALGVALAWSVHLVNRSALAELAAAMRSAGGQPDLVLRGQPGGFDEHIFERAAADPQVQAASPLVEVDSYARRAGGSRVPVHVIGVDALRVAPLEPALRPVPCRRQARRRSPRSTPSVRSPTRRCSSIWPTAPRRRSSSCSPDRPGIACASPAMSPPAERRSS